MACPPRSRRPAPRRYGATLHGREGWSASIWWARGRTLRRRCRNPRIPSFTKGCYVGQELVARIESRGSHTPRRLHVLAADGEIGVGEEVLDHAGDVVGHVTSAVGGSAVALLSRSVDAPCRLELRSGRAVEVSEPAAPGRG